VASRTLLAGASLRARCPFLKGFIKAAFKRSFCRLVTGVYVVCDEHVCDLGFVVAEPRQQAPCNPSLLMPEMLERGMNE